MPRTISAALKAHKLLAATTTCRCWRIRRSDGTNEGWTEHDVELDVDTGEGEGELTYQPLPAGIPSNFAQAADLSPANLEIDLAYGIATETEDLLRGGAYDYAQIWTFEVNWADLSMGILKLAYGRLGQVSLDDGKAKVEVRGLAQLLATNIGDYYTPECRATLGDTACGIDLTPFTFSGSVDSVTEAFRQFIITGAAAGKSGDYYNYGTITFTSGACDGLSMQVDDYNSTNDAVTLIEPMPFAVAAGDTFTISRGCDRRIETCRTFVSAALSGGGTTEGSGLGNRARFRGHPGLPGLDAAFNIPSNQQWTSG